MTPKEPFFRWQRLGRLALKELRETLRDRRTILTLVLMPVLVYPLLGVTFQKFFLAQYADQSPAEYLIAFESMDEAVFFRNVFSNGNQLLGREIRPDIPLPLKSGEPPEPSLKFVFPEQGQQFDLLQTVADLRADIGVRRLKTSSDEQTQFEFIAREGSSLSRAAREFCERRMRAVNDKFVQDFLRDQTPVVKLPVAWSEQQIQGPAAVSDFSLATIVPLVLILMTVTGAVYPAIDLTAGERERGTLEALIAAPISRREVLVAKYIAVVTVALLTAIMNVLAMIATAYGSGLEATLFGSSGLSLLLVVQIFGLLALFAGFFSAIILTITSIARSFKEAQAYLIPIMLLSLAPGVLALMPGLKMTLPLALTPLLNIVVLTRDLLDGHAQPVLALIVVLSSIVYAGLALTLAARIFGTDAVLYGSAGTWTELVQRPTRTSTQGTILIAALALGVLFPAYILLGSIPSRLTTWSLEGRLAASAGLTILLFVIWPLLLAGHMRLRIRAGFGLLPAPALIFVGAALAGLSLWPFAYELEILTIAPHRLKALVELFKGFEQQLAQVHIVWKLAALAVVPAVCEEFFFRGLLLRSFRTAMSPAAAIIATGMLFGLFHVLVRDALMFERFPPTALMGLVLGWVAVKSGSTLPGMLLHVIHNGGLLLLPIWAPSLGQIAAVESQSHLPGTWLLAAGVTACTGLAMIAFSARSASAAVSADPRQTAPVSSKT